ncbi:MAG: phosphoribosylformylglycinamidine cyclo-ligase [Candidatus Ranarchaeia archaeon]
MKEKKPIARRRETGQGTPITYADVGVDTKAILKSQRKIAQYLSRTFQTRKGKIGEVVTQIGHYAGLIKVNDQLLMASHCDGVGTKVLVAQRAHTYDTVGIDCVAMNVNDLVCIGAEPTTLIDYIALEEHRPDLLEQLIKGLTAGAETAQVAVTGGETAIMGPVIRGDRTGYGFDIAACVTGFLHPSRIIDGKKISEKDIVVGLPSSGFHSNGFSLIRRILFEKLQLSINDIFPGNSCKIKNVLLEPTRIYSPIITELLSNDVTVHGIAHITGGAFKKLERLTNKRLGYDLYDFPDPPQIFQTIKELSKITYTELLSTFNCGIGMILVAPPETENTIKKISSKFSLQTKFLGEIIKQPKIQVNILANKIELSTT